MFSAALFTSPSGRTDISQDDTLDGGELRHTNSILLPSAYRSFFTHTGTALGVSVSISQSDRAPYCFTSRLMLSVFAWINMSSGLEQLLRQCLF